MAVVRLLWRRELLVRRREPSLMKEFDELVHAGASVTRERVTDRALVARLRYAPARLSEPLRVSAVR